MSIYKNKIQSNFESVDLAVRNIIQVLKSEEKIINKGVIFKISFMLREILNNAVEHGNKFDESKFIYCEVVKVDSLLHFIVKDEGQGIVFTKEESKEDVLRVRTRGILLINDYGFETLIHGTTIEVKLAIEEGYYV